MAEAGTELLSGLERVGIDPAGLVVDESQLTTTKARIVAEGTLRFPQQVPRLVSDVDAVLISDYQTGAVGPATFQAVLDAVCCQGRLSAVDAQGTFHRYRGLGAVKGNRQEMEATLGMRFRGEQGCRYWPATNRTQVYDVTGAGDTVIAVATLVLSAGASLPVVAQQANHAAGLAVRKLGNAVVALMISPGRSTTSSWEG